MALKIFGGLLALILTVSGAVYLFSRAGKRMVKYQTSYQQGPRNYYVTFEAEPGLDKAPWIHGEITPEKLGALPGAIEVSWTKAVSVPAVGAWAMEPKKPKKAVVLDEDGEPLGEEAAEKPPPTIIWTDCFPEGSRWNCTRKLVDKQDQQSFLRYTGTWLK